MKIRISILLAAVILMTIVSGCWDAQEMDTLKIVTGFCIDKGEQENEIKLTVQIGRGQAQSGGGQQGGGGGQSSSGATFYNLSEDSSTIEEALYKIHNSISGTLFLPQNQICIISEELAYEGITKFLDYFLRSNNIRLEEYLVISEGNAAEIIKEKMEVNVSPSIMLMHMIADREKMSVKLKVNTHDFIIKMLEEPTCPLVPVVKLEKTERTKIKFTGMGVLKDGKLIGKLDEDQTIGFIWTSGKVNQGVFELKCEYGAANLTITEGKTTSTPVLSKDGIIIINIKTKAQFEISEIYGFEDMKINDVIEILKASAAEKINAYIRNCFEKSISLNADIYGFGSMIRKKHPKVWRSIKDSWDEIYPKIQISTNINIKIVDEGKIGNSLVMGVK